MKYKAIVMFLMCTIIACTKDREDVKEPIVEPVLTASFETDVVEIEEGGTVQFSDISNGAIIKRTWFFEGGVPEVSSAKSPVVNYKNPGVYKAELTVFSDTEESFVEKKMFIVVKETPVVAKIPNDYVLAYNFDNTLQDLSSNNIKGMLQNTRFVEGRKGMQNSALLFSSDAKSAVSVGHRNEISLSKEMTMSLWFYSVPQASSSFYTIAEKSNPDDGGHSRYGMWVYKQNVIEICIEPDSCPESLCQECLDAKDPLVLNTWNHVVGVFNGKELKVYINGKLSASKAINSPAGISQTNFELLFGNDKYGFPNYLNGRIDDFRLYDRALSTDEIQKLYEE